MSVGESRSRVAMSRFGVAPPVLQWEVVGPGGVVLGTADFGWPEHGVVGEFDGLVKYGRVLRPGQVPAEAVFAEKRREDRDARRAARASSAGCGRSSTRSPTSRSGCRDERACERVIGTAPAQRWTERQRGCAMSETRAAIPTPV